MLTDKSFNYLTVEDHKEKRAKYMGNSSVMDVALCTQKSTFLHQYLERCLCIVIFDDP